MKKWMVLALALLIVALPLIATAASFQVTSEVSRDGTKVYASPSKDAEVLATLSSGITLTLNDTSGDDWSQFWFIRPNGNEQELGWLPKGSFTRLGYNTDKYNVRGVVLCSSLSMRATPSTTGARITILEYADTFTIATEKGDWYFIQFDDPRSGNTYEGWILSPLTLLNPIYGTILDENTYAYAYPEWDAARVAMLEQGERVLLIHELDEYWVISLRGAAAYVDAESVEVED